MNRKYNHRSKHYWKRNPYDLDAQAEYWNLSDHEHKRVCNGVGSRVGWWAKLTYHFLPNTNWFLDITPVSDIHDYDYSFPEHLQNYIQAAVMRLLADDRFLRNGEHYVNVLTDKEWLKTMRRIRFEKYHLVLREFGESSFLEGKKIDS